MPKSIRTTSNTTNSTLATFKAGDSVLCPSLSFTSFVLTADPRSKRELLALTHDGSYFYYDNKGYFVPSCDKATGDYQPSLFKDTEANRQAVATLYNGRFTTQDNQRKVIDATTANDTEAVLLSSITLSNAACEASGAATALLDIASVLQLIQSEKVSSGQAQSLARLSFEAAELWADILFAQVDKLNEPLSHTIFGEVSIND